MTPQVSASAVVTADTTSAYVGGNAHLAEPQTAVTAPTNVNTQSLVVAAGSDTYHMAVSGAAALASSSLTGSVGGAAALMLTKNLTEAYVGLGAKVQAANDVEVLAQANEDVLLFVAGISSSAGFPSFALADFGGSFPIDAIGSQTHAFIAGHGANDIDPVGRRSTPTATS